MWVEFVPGPPAVRELKVKLFAFLAKIFGVVFVINLMELGEDNAVAVYSELGKYVPVALEILEDELRHEDQLVNLIKEEKLSYISLMVLGLNDALVELTGALAGFTLAFDDNTMIGLAGFITGVAATLSMTASEYLAKKAESREEHPLKGLCIRAARTL
jgi:VIT1/CCC1 family predicted Fe2+/Mn2+ transporter